MAYRGAFFLLMLSTGLTPVISLLVWLTVGAQGVRLPYDRGQFVTYFLLLAVVSMLTASWIAQYTAADIRQGKLSPDLLQPANPILYGIGNNIGEKIVKLPLLLPVVAVAALTLKGLRVPASPVRWLEFAAAVLLAAVIRFLMDYATGLLAFWISDVEGLVRVRDLAAGLLAGQVVPLALFPSSLEPWLRVQPFRYMLSFPLELVTRDIPPGEVAVGFALAAGWLLVFYAAYRLLWTRGLRSYSAAGA
jgi:ABC-2 type transport system permease protein